VLEDVEGIVKDAPSYTILERIDLVLTAVATMTKRPGDLSAFSFVSHYPLVYVSSSDEALFYLRELDTLGYLRVSGAFARVTIRGYERIHQLETAGRQSNAVFVAMSFAPTKDSIYDEAIEPAVSETGYHAVKMNRLEHVNRIDDEIIGQIKRSRFMVADFSDQRPGVYFEAGLMIGLGRNVIWMCEKNELQAVHFDTRQYNFIDYESAAEAKARLFNRILAIEGEGPIPARDRIASVGRAARARSVSTGQIT